MKRQIAFAAALYVVGATIAYSQDAKPLKVGTDIGFAPFTMAQPNGKPIGYTLDLADALAKRLGRPRAEIVDVQFSALFPGLFSGSYEFVISPLGITRERAEQVLFTEGYLQSGLGFMTKQSAAPINGLEDLKGRTVSITRGTSTEIWMRDQKAAEKYGFTIQTYDGAAEAAQAAASGRVDVYVNDLPGVQYSATQIPNMKFAYGFLQDRNYGLAFRPEDTKLRNQVERALECMKIDGSLVEIHKKWLGSAPDPKSSALVVYPGYGAPGFKGYEEGADSGKPPCK